MLWTEQINQMSSPMKGSSFLCHREDFAGLLRNGTLFLRGAIENLGLHNVNVNKEIAYQDFDYLKFQDTDYRRRSISGDGLRRI